MAQSGDKTFLGKGLGRPLALDPPGGVNPASLIASDTQGRIERAAYEDCVRMSIWIILSTSKGERVMRPDFGCDLHELVFSPNGPALADRATNAVRQALLQFETRIYVRDVQAKPSASGDTLLIDIEYEVRATNNVFNIVYPFYLNGSGA
jgi:phage baseplate assembly protein W